MWMRWRLPSSSNVRWIAHSARGRRAAAICSAMLLSSCASPHGAAVRVTVPAGSSFAGAADSLQRAHVIPSAFLFRVYARLRGGESEPHSGTYVLHRDASWGEALRALRTGQGLVDVVTIPEGYSLQQIEPLIADRLGLEMDSLNAAVRDTALLHEVDAPTSTLEGYLFPDTYVFARGTSARVVVRILVRRFEHEWQPEWTERLDTLHMSRHDVLTLASIVEKEARLPAERPAIAAVYLNRLRKNILLEADPTVQYALGTHAGHLYYKDLRVNSPYNTYRYRGLPPGPIASPGSASIQAALYPAALPFEYFVAFPDGHHEFRRTLSAHNLAKREAQRAWDSVTTAQRPDSARRAVGRP